MPSHELIIDTESVPKKEGVYFLTPDNLDQLKYVKQNTFSKATVRNCQVKKLTTAVLQSLYNSLIRGGTATIVVDEPVLVLQDYDANAIASNAEFAGFSDLKYSSTKTFCHGLGTQVDAVTLILTK